MHQAVEQLELQLVRETLKLHCKTPLGIDRSQKLDVFNTRALATENINLIKEMKERLEDEACPPLSGASPVWLELEQAEKQMVLEGSQIIATARTMQVSAQLKRYLIPLDTLAPLLYGLGASLPELKQPAQTILLSFEPSGRLADHASAKLGPLRQRMRAIEDSVQETLATLMNSPDVKKILQEPYFTLRADRYVLPVIASYKNQLAGIVHDASGTGQTVFIEPQRIVQLGNRLKIAQSEVKEEEFRIFSKLSQIISQHAEEIRHSMNIIGQIDLLAASAQLSIDLHCSVILPANEPAVDLINARHPLLVLQKIADPTLPLMANCIGLRENQRVLVLTGPNTGGKTVAMKTVGLLALMMRCGLHLPCDPKSCLGWFNAIHIAIGDQQSIESKLSTLAAHIKNLTRIVEQANENSLVLIDEIAADTDPAQGQAMAQAILEALAKRRAHIIVTTHFEGLKAIPFAKPLFRNAGVGFDAEEFRPTYRVTLDVPQSSNGFDIARSLGMNAEIIERARELYGDDSSEIGDLMKALETRALELQLAQKHTRAAAARHQTAELALKQEQAALEKKRRELHTIAHEELFAEVKTARAQVRNIVADLQKSVSSDAVRDAMRRANEATKNMAAVEQQTQTLVDDHTRNEGNNLKLASVQLGDRIHLPKVGQDGEVIAVDKKVALISIGNMRIRAPIRDLQPPHSRVPARKKSEPKSTPPKKEKERKAVAISFVEEIDLRGLNGDEATARLDAFLDHHYQGPSEHIRIIHGHGTGVLKKVIREHLTRSGYVRSFRPEDEKQGGDGATLVELI